MQNRNASGRRNWARGTDGNRHDSPPRNEPAARYQGNATIISSRFGGPSAEAQPVREAEIKDIELETVHVKYGQGKSATPALGETTLDVMKGEFISFVGPSGCGKSTILRLVSGLVQPSGGVVVVGGREAGAKLLRIGMAFQNASLMPWLTIERNVMLPLKIVQPFRAEYHRKRKGEYRDRVHALLKKVGLADFADHFPWQLSGGMLQRANLCRALIHEPRLLLLDEPFGALDQFTREELWATMQSLWLETRPTVLLVTHDLREAAYLSSRICVMSARPGRIIDDNPVPFAYPRMLDMTYEADFGAFAKGLRELIVGKTAAKDA